MSEIVDRVALAIEVALEGGGVATMTTFQVAARAAIAAAEQASAQEGAEAINPYVDDEPTYTKNLEVALDVWQAMIAEALK